MERGGSTHKPSQTWDLSIIACAWYKFAYNFVREYVQS